MKAFLFEALQWFAKGGVPAFLTSAGMTMVVFAGLDIAVEAALDAAVDEMNGIPSEVLDLALVGGLGEFISILGSALMTRAALIAAQNVMGLGKT